MRQTRTSTFNQFHYAQPLLNHSCTHGQLYQSDYQLLILSIYHILLHLQHFKFQCNLLDIFFNYLLTRYQLPAPLLQFFQPCFQAFSIFLKIQKSQPILLKQSDYVLAILNLCPSSTIHVRQLLLFLKYKFFQHNDIFISGNAAELLCIA